MSKIFFRIIALILTITISSCNQDKTSEKVTSTKDDTFSTLTQFIDYYAEDILSNGNVSSFALAVYKDGQLYQNYYGEIDKVAKNKPNDNSLYEIASITKTFTGSLVVKAVLDKKISLDDDIRKYLDSDYPNLEFQGHPITIKHLLTHSLGFKVKTPPRLEAFNEKMNSNDDLSNIKLYTIADLLEELKSVEVDKEPGTVFAYNSVGPELLAYILEKVNQQPFKAQLNSFLKDIGIHHTYLNESQNHKANLVKGYKGDESVPVGYCPIYGAAGGAISTLPDMAIYMKYLVDNKETPWIKEASKTLFTDPEDDENIGYLWQNIGYADEEGYFYSKTGTSNGIQSGVLICPDSNYGIVLIVNNTSDEAYNDWATLFFRDIEPDVIKYPRLNLASVFKREFDENSKKAFSNFREHKTDTINYFFKLNDLNNYGYRLLNKDKKQRAIEVFKFLTEEFPDKPNTYDSLGEAYFIAEDYKNALINYEKVLELSPDSKNAKVYIKKIKDLSL